MQCNRLRTFHASFLAAEFFEPLTRMVSGYLVELEDLDLDVDLGELRMPGKIPGALETAPLLHSVKLCNKSSFWGPYLRLPWTQLTVLVLKNISLPANTPHILTKCINLEDCTPVVRGWKDNDCPALGIPVAGSIQLLALHTLNLDLSQCHQTSLFFHPLTLPLLSDLTLGYSSRDYIYPFLSIQELQLRSGFEVRRLCLDRAIRSSAELLQTVEIMPSVTDLEIKSWKPYYHLIQRLTYSTTSDAPLPKLEHLKLSGDCLQDNIDDDIADFNESRWWTDTSELSTSTRPISRLRSIALMQESSEGNDSTIMSQRKTVSGNVKQKDWM